MKRMLGVALVAAVALGAAPAGNAARAEDSRLFIGGTTPLTAGYFFPGTGVHDGNRYEYPTPLEVERGGNVVVSNLDEEAVANNHQIRSLKVNRRSKRPLFASKPLRHPGDTVTMITSNLRPGVYKYKCTTHAGMFGAIRVVPAG
jgi:plastocyanin